MVHRNGPPVWNPSRHSTPASPFLYDFTEGFKAMDVEERGISWGASTVPLADTPTMELLEALAYKY